MTSNASPSASASAPTSGSEPSGGFTLDTSGYVAVPVGTDDRLARYFYWPDLSPFVQGYVDAALRALDAQRWAHYRANPGKVCVPLHPAYHWLAPSALALILRDCEKALQPGLGRVNAIESGADFWFLRHKTGIYSDRRRLQYFPPLTVSLSPEGKVELKERA